MSDAEENKKFIGQPKIEIGAVEVDPPLFKYNSVSEKAKNFDYVGGAPIDGLYQLHALFGLRTKADCNQKYVTQEFPRYRLISAEIVLQKIKQLAGIFCGPATIVVLIEKNNRISSRCFELLAEFCPSVTNISRFKPGMFTNDRSRLFVPATHVFITNDLKNKKSFTEALKKRIKIIGFNNLSRYNHLFSCVVPINNYCSFALNYCAYLLYREICILKKIQPKTYYEIY